MNPTYNQQQGVRDVNVANPNAQVQPNQPGVVAHPQGGIQQGALPTINSQQSDSSVKDKMKQAGQKVKEGHHNVMAGLKTKGSAGEQQERVKAEQARAKGAAYGDVAAQKRIAKNQGGLAGTTTTQPQVPQHSY